MRYCCSASPACLRGIREWIRTQLPSSTELPSRCLDEICLAVDEACANVVRHAYGEPEDRTGARAPLQVEVQVLPGRLRVDIRDRGESARPEDLAGRPLEEVRPGGLGWHFIRNAFPIARYRPKSWFRRWNHLRLERPFDTT